MKTITIGLKRANHDGTALLEVDGKELLFNYKTQLNIITEVPRQEIIEEGVTKITMALSSTTNREYTPAAQRVKWFRDELGQLWCKFTNAPEGTDIVIDHVFPSDRVVQVEYLKYPS